MAACNAYQPCVMARHYELTRTDDRSIGRAVSAFLSDLVLEAAYAEGAMQKVKEASETPRLIPGR